MKRHRLQSIDRFLQLPGDSASAEDNLPLLAELVEAEIIRQDGCRILEIVDDIELFPYSEIKDIDSHCQNNLYKHWHFVTGGDEHEYDPAKFLFFDIETTGLSGGAGVVAFLIGFGFFHRNNFRVVQYFLPDYPDESLQLSRAVSHFDSDTLLVSYNGKSFDWPLFSERLTINRIRIPSFNEHLDSLHPARSLFRRLGDDCSLISLEKNLLSFDRGEDVPGYLIPTKYFDYLYDRQPGMIPEIIRHNRLDIISLALVTRYIPEILSRPEKINAARQLEGVINHYYRNRRHTDLIAYVDRVQPGYLEESSEIALLQYSLALKSLAEHDRASGIWKLARETRTGPHLFNHLLELAKHQEHREKDPYSALETVDLMIGLELSPRQRLPLEHRRNRLSSKCRE